MFADAYSMSIAAGHGTPRSVRASRGISLCSGQACSYRVAMTPQEKKRLSYERDRRNTYGENDKSSRKNIPRGKRLAVRATRRSVSVALVDVRGNVDTVGVVEMSGDLGEVDVVDGGPADKVEPRIAGRPPARFRKWPDEPLGAVVAHQLGRRVEADPASRPSPMRVSGASSTASARDCARTWPTSHRGSAG